MSKLLFVYTERGQFSEEEFNDWYDNEHIPGLLPLPGFRSTQRYIQTDSQKPTYLTLYNLTPLDGEGALRTPEFTKHVAEWSAREKKMMTNLPLLNQRTYEPLFQQPITISTPATKYIFIAEVDPTDTSADFDAELNQWYNTIHIPDIMKTNGWVSSRRFQLQENLEFGTSGSVPPPAAKYLAIHEFTNDNYMKDPAMIAAIGCEETQKMASKVKLDLRHFVLHRDFQ